VYQSKDYKDAFQTISPHTYKKTQEKRFRRVTVHLYPEKSTKVTKARRKEKALKFLVFLVSLRLCGD
jgi:hypothetical protein